jgi:hypothetical protein
MLTAELDENRYFWYAGSARRRRGVSLFSNLSSFVSMIVYIFIYLFIHFTLNEDRVK